MSTEDTKGTADTAQPDAETTPKPAEAEKATAKDAIESGFEEQQFDTAENVLAQIDKEEATPKPDAPEDNKDEAKASEAKPEQEEKPVEKEKTESPSALRRRRQREARDRDQKQIEDQKKKIRDLQNQLETLKEVDIEQAESYDEALAHNAAVKVQKDRTQTELNQTQQNISDTETRAFQAGIQDFIESGNEIEGVTDFKDVVFAPNVPFTQDMVAAFVAQDVDAKVAYHLASDPKHAKLLELRDMSPFARAQALGQIERELTAPKAPTQTNAPAPITPTGGSSPTPPKAESEMNYTELRRHLGMDPDGPGYL